MALDWDSLVIGPCQQIFGENPGIVLWQSSGTAGWIEINGIYDEGFLALQPIGGEEDGLTPVHVSTSKPVLGIQLSQFVPYSAPPQQGDLLQIRGNVFRIQEIKPDSHGAATLILNNAE